MENMLGKIVVKIVGFPLTTLKVLYDLVEKMAGDEGQEWLRELKRFLRKEKSWTGEIVKAILEFVDSVAVALTAGEFIVKDNFIVNTDKDAKVKISYLGDNFKENFLDKIENLVGDVSLAYHKLKERSRDIPIIGELGGEDQVETTLGAVFSLMGKQPNGEDGVLLNNGYANIFYVRDNRQVLWAVDVYWHDGGWRVYADPLDHASSWLGGGQVFSRNSSVA